MFQLSLDNNREIHGNFIPSHQIKINNSCMAHLNRTKVVLVENGKAGKWLAGEVGKTPCAVSKWCNYSFQPNLQTLDIIAKLLGIDVKELLN